jgi:hypothetical protein
MGKRRKILRSIGVLVAAGSGCLSIGGAGATDVVIHNETASKKEVRLDISGEGVIDEEFTTPVQLAPDRQHEYNNIVQMNNDYEVSVNIKNGPSGTYSWDDVENALHIFVDNTRDEGKRQLRLLFAKDVTTKGER